MIVDLSGTKCDDAMIKKLMQRLKYFPNLTEFRLRETSISDKGLDAIFRTWQTEADCPIIRLDVSGSAVTLNGLKRLKQNYPRVTTP